MSLATLFGLGILLVGYATLYWAVHLWSGNYASWWGSLAKGCA